MLTRKFTLRLVLIKDDDKKTCPNNL
jgi:hypothetical protein